MYMNQSIETNDNQDAVSIDNTVLGYALVYQSFNLRLVFFYTPFLIVG